jgi:DNA-binding transcriptional MerR regulator
MRKIDDKLIKIASRLKKAGMTLREISTYMEKDFSTIQLWQSHPIWQAETELFVEEKADFILKNTVVVNKLKLFYDKMEFNVNIYEKSLKLLLKRLIELVSDESSSVKEIRLLTGSIRDVDELLRTNLTYAFELDDILTYINESRGIK